MRGMVAILVSAPSTHNCCDYRPYSWNKVVSVLEYYLDFHKTVDECGDSTGVSFVASTRDVLIALQILAKNKGFKRLRQLPGHNRWANQKRQVPLRSIERFRRPSPEVPD